MAQKQAKAIFLNERVTVYVTDSNPYNKQWGRKTGDAVEVSPFVSAKGIELGHYTKTKPKEK